MVLEKKIFRCWKCIFTMSLLSPLEKGVALHLNKLESPTPKDALCQVWLKLAQWFWRRRWRCEKFTDRQTDRQMDGRTDGQMLDDRWSEKLTWAFSSGELKMIYRNIFRWPLMLQMTVDYQPCLLLSPFFQTAPFFQFDGGRSQSQVWSPGWEGDQSSQQPWPVPHQYL